MELEEAYDWDSGEVEGEEHEVGLPLRDHQPVVQKGGEGRTAIESIMIGASWTTA